MKHPIYTEFNLDAKVGVSNLIAVTHTDDRNADVLEVSVRQNGVHIDLTGATAIARMVLHKDRDYLLSDSVPCAVSDGGNILIPFDSAVVPVQKGVIKIEVNLTQADSVLTLQFPLWVSVNGSILDGAEVTPESKGTVPELLKEAADALEDAEKALERLGSYSNLSDKPQINSHTLDGNQSADDLGLQSKLTAGENVTIDENGVISAEGGTDNYNDLSNIPVLFIENNQVPLRGKFFLAGFTDNYNQTNDTHILSIDFLYGTHIAFDSIPNDRLANYWLYMQTHMVGKDFPLSDLYNKYTNDIIWTYDGLNDTPSVVDEVVAVMQIKDVAYRTIQILIGKKFETEFSPFHYECYIREKVGIKEFSDWTVLGNGYTLTQQDKTDIANIVLQELPTTQGVLYGNASN